MSERASVDVGRVLQRQAGLARGGRWLHIEGWRRDHSRGTALWFAPGASMPSLVAKLGRGAGRAGVALESRNLEVLAASPDVELRASVPKKIAFLEYPDLAILLESAVGGSPLHHARIDPETASLELIRWLVRFHQATGSGRTELDRALIERMLLRPFDEYAARLRPGVTEARFLQKMRSFAETLEGMHLPIVHRHGDFCPENVFVEGGRLKVIDWEEPLRDALPGYDLLHYLCCEGLRPGEQDALAMVERLFFTASAPRSRLCLERYAAELAIPAGWLRLLFTEFWLEYALEKLAVEREVVDDGADRGPRAVFGLARFSDGTCENLRYLAHNEERLCLP